MKTLSGTIRLVFIVAVAVAVVLMVRGFAAETSSPSPSPQAKADPDRKFILKITKVHELKNESAFDNALENLPGEAIWKIRKWTNDGKYQDKESKKVSLKTDKVTKSSAAIARSTSDFTPIGVHVTQSVASDSISDIETIVSQLK